MQTIKYYLTKLFSDPAPEPVKPGMTPNIKIPFLRIVLDPYSLFIDYIRQFLVIGSFVALIKTIIALSAGNSYMCIFSEYAAQGYCISNMALFVIIALLNLFLSGLFMIKWYQACYQKQPLSLNFLLAVGKIDVKMFCTLIVFLGLSMISFLSMYLLYVRVPNPDYRIELMYFAAVSLGFLIPFLLVRFYSVFGFVMDGQRVPPLSEIWKRSSGNMLRLLCSIGLLFFIGVFGYFSFMNNFKLVAMKNAVYITFMVEYLYNLLLLMLVAFFANHCYLQQAYLFGRKNNE